MEAVPGSENVRWKEVWKRSRGGGMEGGGNREDISRELRVPVELRPSDRSRTTIVQKARTSGRTEFPPAKFITMNILEE